MSTVYRFADAEVSPARRTLRRSGREVPLQPKVFDLLLLLIRYREQVLTKAELTAALWPGLSVTSAALTRLVKEVRRAVGDDGERQAMVLTVQRRGYRWVTPVEVDGAALEGAPAQGFVDAARGAQAEDDTAEAEASYLRAIALLDDARHADAPLLCDALLALHALQHSRGARRVDPAVLTRALRVCRRHGLHERLARVVVAQAELDQVTPELCTEALREAQDPALRAALLAALSRLYARDPFRHDADGARTRALELCEGLAPHEKRQILGGADDWVFQAIAPARRLSLALSLLDAARAESAHDAVLQARVLVLREQLSRGEVGNFERESAAILAETEQRGLVELTYRTHRLRTAHAIAAGAFERAAHSLSAAAQLGPRLSLARVWSDHDTQRTSLLAAREKLDDVSPFTGLEQGEMPSISSHCVQLWLSACIAEHVQARLELRRLLPAGDLTRLHPADAAIVAASCALLHEPAPATALRHALLPHRGHHVLRGELVCYGPADYFLGVLFELTGELEAARACFRDAEALAERSHLHLSLLRVRLHAASVSESENERRRLAALALAEAERLGLSHARAHAQTLLGPARNHPDRTRHTSVRR
jgi:DNA-binding winged helix-turn-helix (wHTH) protein